jgi:rhodanese-related sulfurtransferase
MKRLIPLFGIIMITLSAWSQSPIDKALKRYNTGIIPYINTDAAFQWHQKDSVLFLDTRALKEYDAHKINALNIAPSTPIVVYCSIGVRSEQIGVKLKQLGYYKIFNLYGGIFQWYNQSHPVVDSQNKPTLALHGYDKNWARYVEKGTPTF